MGKKNNSIFGKLPNKTSEISHIDRYYNRFKSKEAIADDVYNDLNIEDLYHYSNRCITPIGEMVLYYKIRHLCRNVYTEKAETIIEKISTTKSFREQLEIILSKLSRKIDYSVSDIFRISIELSKWHKFFKYLPIVYSVVIIFLWVFGQIFGLILTLISILAINAAIHYWNKLYVEIHIRPLIQLSAIKTAAAQISNHIDNYQNTADVNESINIISKLEKKIIIFGLNRYLESDFAILLSFVVEFVKITFLVEPIIVNNIAGKTADLEQHSKRLIDYIGEWDTLFSNASLRTWLADNSLSYSKPVYKETETHSLKAKEMYNPLVSDCVDNNVDINKPIVITGSNMSGKSTFLKTIGINIVSSYALNISYASYLELNNFKLYTVLSVSDDINESTSYFRSEVERIKYAIDGCAESHPTCINIVLIDEIFKGTNTIERIAIANAVIKYFTNLGNTLAIVSTHDIELAKSFLGILDIYHFDEKIEDQRISFDYKLKYGLEYSRNAIALLKYFNYPADIISCAETNKSLINIKLEL